MKETELKKPDKIEITKQQSEEITTRLESRFLPKRGHTMFEVNLKEETIKKAIFDELPAIRYEEALKGNIIAQKKITKKDYCIYISALNIKNVIKIMKRDYNIIIRSKQYKFVCLKAINN